MAVSVSAAANVTGLIGLIAWLNQVTLGMFGWTFLAIFFVVTFVTMKVYDTERAFASSSFITGILGIMFGVAGIVNTPVTLICIFLAFAGIAGVLWKNA